MCKFFRKHDYQVTSNVTSYTEVLSKKAFMRAEDIHSYLDDYLLRAKAHSHFFIYYSGILLENYDSNEELCGVDSEGSIIYLQRYCEAFAQ